MNADVLCPAKVNLYLYVGAPDATGYHPLRTQFQAIGLYDRLTVKTADTDSFEAVGMDLGADNTVTRTLRLARELLPIPPLAIKLEKTIPHQAGLGGGSSDAAGLLKIISRGMGVPLTGFLTDVAVSVGADVAFFLMGGRANAEGYGEKLTPVSVTDPEWVVIHMPEAAVSTPAAYRALDHMERVSSLDRSSGGDANDFELVAPEPSQQFIHSWRSRGIPAGLCGSGAAVYGRFRAESEARLFASETPGSWVAPFLAQSEMPKVTPF